MPNYSQDDHLQQKLDLSAVRFQARMMRLRACKMRIDSLILRVKTKARRERNRNLIAIYREWFIE